MSGGIWCHVQDTAHTKPRDRIQGLSNKFLLAKKDVAGQETLNERWHPGCRGSAQSSAYELGGHRLKERVDVNAAVLHAVRGKQSKICISCAAQTRGYIVLDGSKAPLLDEQHDAAARSVVTREAAAQARKYNAQVTTVICKAAQGQNGSGKGRPRVVAHVQVYKARVLIPNIYNVVGSGG